MADGHEVLVSALPTRIALAVLSFYQIFISPFLGPRCRFAPSCSEYAAEAVRRYGLGGGGFLSIKRILRCHPFGGHGYDPVPHDWTWRDWTWRKGHAQSSRICDVSSRHTHDLSHDSKAGRQEKRQ